MVQQATAHARLAAGSGVPSPTPWRMFMHANARCPRGSQFTPHDSLNPLAHADAAGVVGSGTPLPAVGVGLQRTTLHLDRLATLAWARDVARWEGKGNRGVSRWIISIGDRCFYK